LSPSQHPRPSGWYFQVSNGKIESWHKTVKRKCIRPLTPLNLGDARRIVANFVHEYNTVRLHSGIGYVTPLARLEGRDQHIIEERHTKLATAREARQLAHGQSQPEQQVALQAVA
jgi:putative transposase